MPVDSPRLTEKRRKHEEETGEPLPGFRALRRRSAGSDPEREKRKPMRKILPSIGRNDPCYCGSQKKYKKCCLRSDPVLSI